MLEFKIENLPIKIGTEELQLKTRDLSINEWIKDTVRIKMENENKSDQELGFIIMEQMSDKLVPFLKNLVIEGNADLIELLNLKEQMEIVQELSTGFHS